MVAPFPAEDYRCSSCAIEYRQLTVTWALDRTAGAPAAVTRRLHGLPGDVLRRRPSTGWSMLEYVCHLRDVYATYTIRLHRSRTEDCPQLEPMLNDLRAIRFRYNDLPHEHVLTELTSNAEGLRDEIAELTAADLERPMSRQAGEHRSTLWLIRQAAHETVHHLGDLDRLTPANHSSVADPPANV